MLMISCSICEMVIEGVESWRLQRMVISSCLVCESVAIWSALKI
jgi:hypothetical protein